MYYWDIRYHLSRLDEWNQNMNPPTRTPIDDDMNRQDECIRHMRAGLPVDPGTEIGQTMLEMSAHGRAIVARMNRESQNDDDAREFFAELIDAEVPESFQVFLPFTSDFGRNIIVGENVFINSGCRFQDQGGIKLGDGALIGHNVVITTLNHDMDPARRAIMHPKPVDIGPSAWIGSGSIILPGVSVGSGSIVGAGSVVTRDIPAMTVAVGSPARPVRTLESESQGEGPLK